MTESASIFAASKSAWRGLEPPFPHTYTFQPLSVAITPKSLLCASAHSRMQPLTADLSLCGARIPLYRSSMRNAKDTESCTPKRHQVEPTQLLTVRSALP